MSIVKLKEYGANLSGRALGIKTYSIILSSHQGPFDLDCDEVNSIGSSFADEVVAKLAELNGGSIRILNSSRVIDKCLRDTASDKGFELIFSRT